MRALVVIVTWGLVGCQIIINHNHFESGVDSAADDGAPDAIPPPANVVRSTAAEGVLLVSAFVEPSGAFTSDGNWLTSSTPRVDGDFLRYDLVFPAFSAPPSCACTTVGGNNHGCNFTSVQTSTATLSVFDIVGGLQSRQAYLTCVGQRADAIAGLATSPDTRTMLLSTLRYDRTAVNSPVLTEDGSWVGAAVPGNPPFPLTLDPVYAQPPNCTCTGTLDGNPGASNCKLEVPTTTGGIQLSESANSGPGNPVAHDLACLGPSATSAGPFIVSSSPAGMIVASATIDGAGNAVRRQDGAWIRPSPDGVNGGQNNAVKYEMTVFGGAPRCLCAPLDTDGVGCHVLSAPNTTDFSIHVMATRPTLPNATSAESDFSLICIGPPKPS